MGLAFDAIEPIVYPVAYELFESGMERHWVAGHIFKKFGKRCHATEDEVSAAMIDLSISCAERDYKNFKKKNNTVEGLENANNTTTGTGCRQPKIVKN